MQLSYYFDYNATTPVDPRVLKEMEPYFTKKFHNPSSFYRDAGEASYAIDEARNRVAHLLQAEPGEIIFTGGGTEADNLAIFGVISKLKNRGNHIITSAIEHPAVLKSCEFLAKNGFDITYLPVDSLGYVDPAQLRKSITGKTILISIMHANNEIGTIQDLNELIKVAKEAGVYFHTDAVQSTGKIPINVKELGVDLLSCSGHKIYGPKGVGVLYRKKGTKMDPLIFGGGHERGMRGGTENVPGIIGMGKAAELAGIEMVEEKEILTPLRDQIKAGIEETIPEIIINGDPERGLYNTLNVSLKYVEGESILGMLDAQGFALSSGSACSSKSLDPSHVLLAIGLKHEDAHGSLRISLGKYNTQEGVDKLVETLPPVIKKLRDISPFWANR